ncbi:MAG: hypothetical protein ACK4QP_08185 [Pseudorhizobium sp.]
MAPVQAKWPSRLLARAVRSVVTEGHVSVRTKNGIIIALFERVDEHGQ